MPSNRNRLAHLVAGILPLVLSLAAASPALAHPVPYAGSVGIMGWNNPRQTEWMGTYSPERFFALAGRYYHLRARTGEREYLIPSLNLLLYRINADEGQANLYLSGGYGLERWQGSSRGAGLVEAESDWENRRFYADAKLAMFRLGQAGPFNDARLRLGVAPYLAEFEQLHSWLILQLARNRATGSDTMVTPMLRMFYQNVLFEAGSSLRGEWELNFMFHF